MHERHYSNEFISITDVVPLNGSIAETVVTMADELHSKGYKVISHNVATLHHSSSTVVNLLGKRKA